MTWDHGTLTRPASKQSRACTEGKSCREAPVVGADQNHEQRACHQNLLHSAQALEHWQASPWDCHPGNLLGPAGGQWSRHPRSLSQIPLKNPWRSPWGPPCWGGRDCWGCWDQPCGGGDWNACWHRWRMAQRYPGCGPRRCCGGLRLDGGLSSLACPRTAGPTAQQPTA